ncbi:MULTISPECIES: DUF4097 family beta strand repeat-containing protein [unclassified Streptomyces]|uniref:DUF4097 family beta strand repeat-containing protein n=1 Tax=unclassified Streptomyces TaxID=2593676 RepID=UPI0022866D4E|nr:DUF4097 family beta strand repeat-containing protein [Streptomyces sp. Je 1-369]WAL98066.1 DUF4097 family beta strand repeat-containing protein [Streptomyces sp. Je 1-369]
MPSFDSPKPISATVTLRVGTLRITAGDRKNTVVDVRPSSATQEADVKAAERTRVEFANGKLLVKGPKDRPMFGKGPSVDVDIVLPTGSGVHATTVMAHVSAQGGLGDCEVKVSAGDIQLERTASAKLTTGYGDVSLGRADGQVDISTSSGEIRVGEVRGTVDIKNSNGITVLGDVDGDIKVKASNGSVTVDRAAADISVKTANGAVRLGEVARGETVVEAAAGKVEIGIREGTAAWLDVRTKVGTVSQALEESGPSVPEEPADTVKVHVRTGIGDIKIHRA